jgi:flavin reductase (DIM6/NTAB) family NADH-FMN oxidoreductase RutF
MKRMDPCAFLLSTDIVSGHVSGMAVTWMNRCDKKSWMVSVKQSSYTMQLIRSSREFVIALAGSTQADELTYFGSAKGHDTGIDKLADTGLITMQFADSRIRTPGVQSAYRNIACKVGGILPVSDEYAIVYGNIIEQRDDPFVEQLFYCGKDERGNRHYGVQHEQSANHVHIADILPGRSFSPIGLVV